MSAPSQDGADSFYTPQRFTNMKTPGRFFVAVLGSLACLGLGGTAAAAGNARPPGEVIQSDIYDPLGLVSKHGQLVILEDGFSFTEGPAVDRHGNVFFTDYFAGVMRRLVNLGGAWSLASPVPGQPANENWGTGFDSVSDWAMGPEGSLYYCHQGGEIRRIVADTTTTPPPTPTPAPTVDFRSPYPSPSAGAVTFDFTIGQVSRVRLVIYDMSGARIRTVLVDDAAPAEAGELGREPCVPDRLPLDVLTSDGSTNRKSSAGRARVATVRCLPPVG